MTLPTLPPLPLALPALPALPTLAPAPLYSIWYPMSRAPWQPGWYELQEDGGAINADRAHWNGIEWDAMPDLLRVACAWRGLAQQP